MTKARAIKIVQEFIKHKKFYVKIMDEDKELKKWYKDFLNEIVNAKENELFEVSQYRKEAFLIPKFL